MHFLLSLALSLQPYMPSPDDVSTLWWRDGFPGRVEGAPWHRCVHSGHFAFIQDTETLRIPHLGSPNLGAAHRPADLALQISAGGKTYHCRGAAAWSRFEGPRIIASGSLVQRTDVTGLSFVADDGEQLTVEANLETVAWPDRLSFILNARPGKVPIAAGEAAFGKSGGGYGITADHALRIPHRPELDPSKFTIAMWVYVPADYRAETHEPWLLCKNHHEAHPGNIGITIRDGRPVARLNIGGPHSVTGHSFRLKRWNHLLMSYDGHNLRLYQNSRQTGELRIERPRKPGDQELVIGQRPNSRGYGFRGVIDDLQIFDRAVSPRELGKAKPVASWHFREDGQASSGQLRADLSGARMQIRLGEATASSELSKDWRQAHVVAVGPPASAIQVKTTVPTQFDAARGWHRIDLNRVRPIIPNGRHNDSINRLPFTLHNPSDQPQVARLLFAKSAFRSRMGSTITGVTAMLRSPDGQPTGLPVQLSKNWHYHALGGEHQGQWFTGFSHIRLPPKASLELELTMSYGHWGGVAAASHAQLSLIGWGSNQLWEESAMGSWGESICYEPDRAQAGCNVTDVRPLMLRNPQNNRHWGWTANVGGADFARIFAPNGKYLPHQNVRPSYQRQGPCLTEVTYGSQVAKSLSCQATVSIARSDDIVRGSYQLDIQVKKPIPFSRAVLFQLGSDRYNPNREAQIAMGDTSGVHKNWPRKAKQGPMPCTGETPWLSLHRASSLGGKAAANRGLVIRRWEAVLGGKPAAPWMLDSGTVDIVPPPRCRTLLPGDYVRATFEHIIVPQSLADYYGPSAELRAALAKSADSWQMIHREAAENSRHISMQTGKLLRRHPDVRVQTAADAASYTLRSGLGYVPLTFTNLTTPFGHELLLDGEPLDQEVHGNDFWQTDYDAISRTWSRSYTVPIGQAERQVQFRPVPKR
jgi:hypothetical protein